MWLTDDAIVMFFSVGVCYEYVSGINIGWAGIWVGKHIIILLIVFKPSKVVIYGQAQSTKKTVRTLVKKCVFPPFFVVVLFHFFFFFHPPANGAK